VVRKYDELRVLQVAAPMINGDKNGKVFLVIGRKSTRARAQSLADER
jgi:hypothetical protein